MSPKEHYEKAEELLEWAANDECPELLTAMAQVHATLALFTPAVSINVQNPKSADEIYRQREEGARLARNPEALDRLDIGTADAESLTGWDGSPPSGSTEDGPREVRQRPHLWFVEAQGRTNAGDSSAYVDTEKRAKHYAKLFLDTGYMAVSIRPPVTDPFIEITTERPVQP